MGRTVGELEEYYLYIFFNKQITKNMSAIGYYPIDFVKRTKDLVLKNFDKFKDEDSEVTFLLNCLLGLIVSVSENEKKSNKTFKGKIDDDFLLNLPDKIGFIINNSNDNEISNTNLFEINTKIGHKDDLKTRTKLWFINILRNCIAHQNIQAINDDTKWVGLKLFNTNNSDVKDFEIIFTIQELKDLSIKIAEEYLKSMDPKNQE